jgi:hypothetical protein
MVETEMANEDVNCGLRNYNVGKCMVPTAVVWGLEVDSASASRAGKDAGIGLG